MSEAAHTFSGLGLAGISTLATLTASAVVFAMPGGNREYLLRRVEAFAKRNRQYAEENKELKENLKLLEESDNECISDEAAGGVFALAP